MSRLIPGLLVLVLVAGNVVAERLYCHRCASAFLTAAAPDSPDFRKFARDRKIDVEHLRLEVTPDYERHTVSGTAKIRFKPIGMPLREVAFDGVDLTVQSVRSGRQLEDYQVTADKVVCTFTKVVPVGTTVEVSIAYSAEPQKGLYFRTPKNGYPAKSQQIWTQGEPHEARHWFPVYDYPNEKFTSEIICHVPKGMTVLSNGKLLSTKPSGKLTAHHWRQDKPHVAYLITLVAGYMAKIEDDYKGVPLTFWTAPEDLGVAQNSFRHTKHMMKFFERETGMKYPWSRYGQVTVHGFMWGGMENTGLSTLSRRTLFDDSTEDVFSSDSLVAHELAHQWFGDYVTCKDWSQLWLNEGFATYYDALWHGDFFGEDQFKYEMWHNARSVLSQKNEKRGIVYRGYGKPTDMFNYLVYPKGAWVLHMLRSQLGPDLYRKGVIEYLRRNPFGVVETADLKLALEDVSGRSFDRFFDQWLNGIGAPKLSVSHSWDAKTKLAKVTVRQTQKIDEKNPLFRFPLTIRFKDAVRSVDHRVEIREKQHEFHVPLKGAPTVVRVDPEYTLLATVDFKKPNAMLYAQLANKTDMIGRMLAAQQLGTKKDQQTVTKLQAALNGDAFHGVRVAAANALKKIHNDAALEVLIGSRSQENALVRKTVHEGISSFYDGKASAALADTLNSEKNPAVVASALSGIARWGGPGTKAVILQAAKLSSMRDTAVDGAITAMRTNGDPAFANDLRKMLIARSGELKERAFNKGLEAVAFLTQNETDKSVARSFLTGYVKHSRRSTKLAAIKALGVLGDPRSISVLEAFTSADEESPEHKAAKSAIDKLRAEKKTAPEVRDLRREVEALKKANDGLRKQFEDLRKKQSAKQSQPLL